MKVTVQIAIVAIVLVSNVSAIGAEHDWYKYENTYFEVYSNASEKSVRGLLQELENFRAAVVQVLALTIPPGSVKTQVVAFRSAKEFRRLGHERNIAAFVVKLRDIPHIVMPITKLGKDAEFYIRHEYTHVLMVYSGHRFPFWYNEGFAEFMSGTQFMEKGTKFTLGGLIPRRRVGSASVPWAELMSEDFDFDSLSSPEEKSNAYYQAWLLVHYLTIGEELENYPKLTRYLGRFAAGESSISALEAEFGLSPEELGSIVEKKYRRLYTYYTLDFQPGIQDHHFSRTEAHTDAVEETVAEIRQLIESSR